MPNLKDIKSRINNVTITGKVTFSMKNIAAAKLANSRRFYYSGKNYFEYNRKILQYLLLSFKNNSYNGTDLIKSIFIDNPNLPTLIFTIASDKGLCGAFNINVIKVTENLIKDLQSENKDFLIITLGTKIKNYFERKYKEKVFSFPYKLDIGSFGREESLLIANYIFRQILEHKVGSIKFVYTQFISVLQNIAKVVSILPVDVASIKTDDNKEANLAELNIVTDSFIESSIPQVTKDIILSWVYEAIINSLTSEYSSRVNAMDNATNNSNELLRNLSLEYNRTRQSLITKELIEIISGNEAL